MMKRMQKQTKNWHHTKLIKSEINLCAKGYEMIKVYINNEKIKQTVN